MLEKITKDECEKILSQYSIIGSAEELISTEFSFQKEIKKKYNNKIKIGYEKISDEYEEDTKKIFIALISKWKEIFAQEDFVNKNYDYIDIDDERNIISYTYYYTTKEMGNYIRCEVLTTNVTKLVVKEKLHGNTTEAIFASNKKLSYPLSIFAVICPECYSTFCEFRKNYKNFELK